MSTHFASQPVPSPWHRDGCPATAVRRTRPLIAAVAISLACLTGYWPSVAGELSQPAAENVIFVSDQATGLRLQHRQQWGDFGFDVATAPTGGKGAVLQIGETTYGRGLGHHANGEIEIDLDGRFQRFRTLVGVQWQGGDRGSVVFRVEVDGVQRFQTGPLSDSDPAEPIDLPLAGARQLRLIASDAGDGIGCDMANWVQARLEVDPRIPLFGSSRITLGEQPADADAAAQAAANGFHLIAFPAGPQVAVRPSAGLVTCGVDPGEEVRWTVPVSNVNQPVRIRADGRVVQPGNAVKRFEPARTDIGERSRPKSPSRREGEEDASQRSQPGRGQVELAVGEHRITREVAFGDCVRLTTPPVRLGSPSEIVLTVRGGESPAGVCWSGLSYAVDDRWLPVPVALPAVAETIPPPVMPTLRPAIEQELIEWDWRLQDGIGTPQERRSWDEAIRQVLDRGDQLLERLESAGAVSQETVTAWQALRTRRDELASADTADQPPWEQLWREAHALRRELLLAHPLAPREPLLFVKRVPSSFSHQLTQYAGRCARPGGGVFVLDQPGRSMHARRLDNLPPGSCLHPDVSWDGGRVLFAFCETDPAARDWRTNERQFYHLYEMSADGSGLRQLTDEPYDDFSPRYLPSGDLLFLSTRRGGFHRCGRGPCPVHTLATARPDGSQPRVISFHETHEWDPCVLDDGRVIYTRWDYVDRHAVHYQQLWTVRPDGSDVRAYYGNHTLNPVGVWEARPIPGTHRVMATAAAHHAMTAGSIISLDVTQGIDGLAPITRLTPDALFPESEFPVQRWHAAAGVPVRPDVPPAERRWPGHCYRTPYPLAEDLFLAAYSFTPLVGEPDANPANMFGIYLVDRFGNKELLYRDVAIGSLWPTPLAARPRPPVVPALRVANQPGEGTFLVQNIRASWPPLSPPGAGEPLDAVKRLRIVQVLPKTTPNANTPRVGLANASPGKQVLGTVPVEPDGSAYFRAPAGIPLLFQALDERGRAIQTMRSLTYLQPGEQAGCVGCHEQRTTAPASGGICLASQRQPSAIEPGPDGSLPLNFARLVQPVLDRQCTSCHGVDKTEGGIDLTGAADGPFTRSYQALAPLVPFSQWEGSPQANHEPLSPPNQFGARASRLLTLLDEGHEGVRLTADDYERLITWMDANALFYGTFDPDDQRRQQRGERIAGPALE